MMHTVPTNHEHADLSSRSSAQRLISTNQPIIEPIFGEGELARPSCDYCYFMTAMTAASEPSGEGAVDSNVDKDGLIGIFTI